MTRIITTLVLFALVLTSCSNDETIDDITILGTEVGLKTYTLSKDANGKYSIDYEVNDYTSVQSVTNEKTNTNEFYLSSGDIVTENKSEKNLVFNDNYLEVSFYQDAATRRGFIIEDDGASAEDSLYLESYSIQDLGNDTYQVDFKVKEGVAVSFNYNEEENIYEINLANGTSATQEFSKTFVKNYEGVKIDFVNYVGSAKSAKASSSIRRPRVLSLG